MIIELPVVLVKWKQYRDVKEMKASSIEQKLFWR